MAMKKKEMPAAAAQMDAPARVAQSPGKKLGHLKKAPPDHSAAMRKKNIRKVLITLLAMAGAPTVSTDQERVLCEWLDKEVSKL